VTETLRPRLTTSAAAEPLQRFTIMADGIDALTPGLPVFPWTIGKKPAISREKCGCGYLDTTTDGFRQQAISFAPVRSITVFVGSAMLINDVVTQAAARLNLIYGRDNIWRGRCPACGYAKPTLELGVQCDRIEIRCIACGADASIARNPGHGIRGEDRAR
jgi:hypothetical protein